MKRKALLSALTLGTVLTFNSHPLLAQKSKKPALAEEGRSLEELLPKGWNAQHSTGDLNKDGIEDIILIAHPNDPEYFKKRDDGYEYDFSPAILAVYFGSPTGVYKRFKVWKEAVPHREDEYTEIGVELSVTPKGAIDFNVSSWSSMGTADTGSTTYRYRYQSGDFYLIGEETGWHNRMTGEGEKTSINYITGKKSITSGNMIENTDMKTKIIKLKKEPLRRLGSFTMQP